MPLSPRLICDLSMFCIMGMWYWTSAGDLRQENEKLSWWVDRWKEQEKGRVTNENILSRHWSRMEAAVWGGARRASGQSWENRAVFHDAVRKDRYSVALSDRLSWNMAQTWVMSFLHIFLSSKLPKGWKLIMSAKKFNWTSAESPHSSSHTDRWVCVALFIWY